MEDPTEIIPLSATQISAPGHLEAASLSGQCYRIPSILGAACIQVGKSI
jgi:hypothetical protein